MQPCFVVFAPPETVDNACDNCRSFLFLDVVRDKCILAWSKMAEIRVASDGMVTTMLQIFVLLLECQ
jgi:hypothetical protein